MQTLRRWNRREHSSIYIYILSLAIVSGSRNQNFKPGCCQNYEQFMSKKKTIPENSCENYEQPHFSKTCLETPRHGLGRPLKKCIFQTRPQNLYSEIELAESFNFQPELSKMVHSVTIYGHFKILIKTRHIYMVNVP